MAILLILAGILTAIGLTILFFFLVRKRGWRGLLVPMIAIVVLVGSWQIFKRVTHSKQQAGVATASIVAPEESYTFPDGVNQITVPLHPTRWSGWVTTPLYSWYDISPPDSGYVETVFRDGTRIKQFPGQLMPKVGVKRGVFKHRGTAGFAEIVIKRR